MTTSDNPSGFDTARHVMWCYEARRRTHRGLTLTPFLADPRVCAVHLDTTARADRVYLTAYDQTGCLLDADILFVDNPSERLDVTPEFDHDFTNMPVAPGSPLAEIISVNTGWVIDMDTLRDYDPAGDRLATQRAAFLAHLGDMMADGRIQGFLLGSSDEYGSSDAA